MHFGVANASWNDIVMRAIFELLWPWPYLASWAICYCIVLGAYLLYCFREVFQIWCVDVSWDGYVSLWPLPWTLTSCREHISYIIWGRNSKFGLWMHLGMAECHVSFGVTVALTSDLIFRIIVSQVYFFYIIWGRNLHFGMCLFWSLVGSHSIIFKQLTCLRTCW